MTDKSASKTIVTRLKNKIINSLHEVEVEKLVEVAKLLSIRVNPQLDKLSRIKDKIQD